jgi:uncharacterized membrane protein
VPFGTPTLFTAGLVGNTVASAALTTDALVPAGGLIVILTYEDGTSSLAGNVTDSVNGSTGWVKPNSSVCNSNSTGWGAIFYNRLTADLPAGTVITYTCGTAARHGWLCGAWVIGALASGLLDLNPVPYSGASASAVLASGTPSFPNEILFAGFVGNAAASYAVTSAPGWTNLLTVNGATTNPGVFFGYIQETTPAAQTCTVANTGGRAAAMFILSFKPTIVVQQVISCSSGQNVQSIKRTSKSPFALSNPELVSFSKLSSRKLPIALSSSELFSYKRAVNKTVPLTSNELITVARIKTLNVLRSITNSQLFSYIRGITKTVPLIFSTELFSFAKRSSRNLSVSLSSSELVTVLRKTSTIISLQNTELFTYLRGIFKRVTLQSPELVTVLRPKLAIKNVLIASNSNLDLTSQVSLIKKITDSQVFSYTRTISKGRTVSLTSPELLSQVQGITKTVFLSSSELVTTAKIIASNLVRSITNSQLLSSTKAVNKTVTLSSSELFLYVRRVSTTVLLSSTEFLTTRLGSRKTVLLASSELVGVSKSVFRRISLSSSQLFSMIKLKLPQRSLALVSSQALAVIRRNATTLYIATPPQLLLITKTIKNTISLHTASIVTLATSVGRATTYQNVINFATGQTVALVVKTAIGTIIASFTNHQIFSLVKRDVSKVLLVHVQSIITVIRRTSRTISLVTPVTLRLIRETRKIYILSNPTTVSFSAIKIGRIIVAFSNHQIVTLRKIMSKMLAYTSPTRLLASFGRLREKVVPLIWNPSTLGLIRSGGRVFPLFNPTTVNLKPARYVQKALVVIQSQHLKFSIPNLSIRLTQAQHFVLKISTPGKVIAIMQQHQYFKISRIAVSKTIDITTLIVVALSRPRVLSQTAFALLSSSRLTLGQRTGKIMLFKSFSKLSVSRNAYRTRVISFLSRSVLSVSRRITNQLAIHLSNNQLVNVKKFTGKLFKLSTHVGLLVTRAFNKILRLHQPEVLKSVAGKGWALTVRFTTQSRVTVTIITGVGVIINLIQNSAITVYTKVRTLIQKAIILLVGA